MWGGVGGWGAQQQDRRRAGLAAAPGNAGVAACPWPATVASPLWHAIRSQHGSTHPIAAQHHVRLEDLNHLCHAVHRCWHQHRHALAPIVLEAGAHGLWRKAGFGVGRDRERRDLCSRDGWAYTGASTCGAPPAPQRPSPKQRTRQRRLRPHGSEDSSWAASDAFLIAAMMALVSSAVRACGVLYWRGEAGTRRAESPCPHPPSSRCHSPPHLPAMPSPTAPKSRTLKRTG